MGGSGGFGGAVTGTIGVVGQGFAVVVVGGLVVVGGGGVVGMIHVVATKKGTGVAGGGVSAGITGAGGMTAALACILAIRACDLYIMPRKLSQSSLECNAGVSSHFIALSA